MRLLLWTLWLALIAVWFSGCRKPVEPGVGLGIEAPERMLTDGIVTCELRKDQFGHVYEKSNVPLGQCFGIWLMDNAEQDHYEEWFHSRYGDPLNQEGRKQAQTHLLGRS